MVGITMPTGLGIAILKKVRFLKMGFPGRGSGHHIQGSKKVLGKKLSELDLPGRQMIPTYRGSILHAVKPSQVPYNAKSDL